MKHKIVIVGIAFLSIFLTGCTVEYKVKINKDFSIEESINAYGDNDFYKNYPLSSKNTVINFIISPHIDYLNENNYDYKNYLVSSGGGVNIYGEHTNIENYLSNSKFYKQFYETIEYDVDNHIHTISNSSIFLTYNENDPERFMVEESIVVLEIPYKVVSSNADKVDKIRGLYQWNIYKDTNDKDINISFDDRVININYYSYIDEVIYLTIVIGLSWVAWSLLKNKKNNNQI